LQEEIVGYESSPDSPGRNRRLRKFPWQSVRKS